MATERVQELERHSYPAGQSALLQRPITPAVMPPALPPEPSYYDIPMLQCPVWKWEIATYFFLGGLSAGAYLLARVAERLGGRTYRDLTRVGTGIAFGAIVPCAPLLIADLGDPKRFHHMLRVFKPKSPMNLGSWTLTAYSGVVTFAALREWLRRHPEEAPGALDRIAMGIADTLGIPLALLFSGYTGVLLSATATPVWAKNPWLGALFTASGLANGCAAIHLALAARKGTGEEQDERPEEKALMTINTAAHMSEGGLIAAYLPGAGKLAQPLTHGRESLLFWGAIGGITAAEVFKRVRAPRRHRGWLKVVGTAAGLLSGLALKWALVHAGPASAADPEADRKVTHPPA